MSLNDAGLVPKSEKSQLKTDMENPDLEEPQMPGREKRFAGKGSPFTTSLCHFTSGLDPQAETKRGKPSRYSNSEGLLHMPATNAGCPVPTAHLCSRSGPLVLTCLPRC